MDGSRTPLTACPAVEAAERRIGALIRRTPVVRVAAADLGLSGQPVALKLEHLQHAGTFKTRAAFAQLLEPGAVSGPVAAASHGNYGVAAAYAAARLGRRARIFVPGGVPAAKIARMRGYGAEIAETSGVAGAVVAAATAWCAATGGQLLKGDCQAAFHGAGTIGTELARDGGFDTLLVPVGSGALIAGLALAVPETVALVAVEPVRAPGLSRALAAGVPVAVEASGIAADTLGATRVGALAFAILSRRVRQAVLVTDYAILGAQHMLWRELRLSIEPGGAAALAALLAGAYRPRADERVAVLLTGANAPPVAA